MGLQSFPERAQRIAVTRSGGVLRNFQNLPDLGESELVPNFQNDDLSLIVRQTFNRGGEHLLTFIHGRELRLEMRLALKCGGNFPPCAALVAAQPVESGRANCSVEERAIFDRVLAPPKTDKRFLHDVLGFGAAICPAARKKEQGGAELSETVLPVLFTTRALHFFFTIF
jgi:hypothetical protein